MTCLEQADQDDSFPTDMGPISNEQPNEPVLTTVDFDFGSTPVGYGLLLSRLLDTARTLIYVHAGVNQVFITSVSRTPE